MSTRCRACNNQLSKFDFTSRNSDNPEEWEDLCSSCRGAVYSSEYYYDHDYQHQDLTESVYNIVHK